MKAMILAAGLGTRLKPITDTLPKALVPVEGVPMLERVILKLKDNGFDEIIINVHHFADKIIDFLSTRHYGIEISVSDEREELLDTGGGIVRAMPLLFRKNDSPVLVHNVDILSNANLQDLMQKGEKDSTLLVSQRDSTRKLIFDPNMFLRGWHDLKTDNYRPDGFIQESNFDEYAFSGIYVLTKKSILEMKQLVGEGKYSVMDYFLHSLRSEKIKGYVSKDLRMIDIGKPSSLENASLFLS